ncbi:MAG TPA: cell division protein SepF [Clostridiaceae bacterium]|jgi:cell division inhibitor SepF|nr:cell division protein SepF [Clostridiaceae bacterium]HBG38740.1 cell division protein SepF [Clostridiaceae bacterium]HBN28473.1 cell division protein SepF [Clostridiaceae bacterium]HBX49187.1 cell division protein SepF [Clostridiaceae bacterium]HCL50840.1 cell division protein SepF [Clostridiaceae bacterium]
MSKKILNPFNKMMEAIGLVDDDDDNEEENSTDEFNSEDEEEDVIEPPISNNSRNKIVSIKTNGNPRVLLKKPIEFQDIMEIVDSIKSRKIVIMNLTDVESKLAQRMIDYVVGAMYALQGSFEEIARYIYILAPDNVDITNDLKQEIDKTDFLSFGSK